MVISEKPIISIITPVYNGEKYLERLILSIQQQLDRNIEYIIIDDGSTDNTLQIVKKHPFVRCYSHQNIGQYASMNVGIEKASGEYICFISADDLLTPNILLIIQQELKKNSYPDGIYGKTQYVNESETPLIIQNHITKGGLLIYKYFHHISHCALYIKKDFITTNHLYFNSELRCTGDYEWLIRILQKKVKFIYIDRYLSLSRVHPDQASHKMLDLTITEQHSVFQKYGVNIFVFNLLKNFLTIYNGFIRLFWDWRENGWNVFTSRLIDYKDKKRRI